MIEMLSYRKKSLFQMHIKKVAEPWILIDYADCQLFAKLWLWVENTWINTIFWVLLFLHTPMCKLAPQFLVRKYNLHWFLCFPLKTMIKPITDHLHTQLNLNCSAKFITRPSKNTFLHSWALLSSKIFSFLTGTCSLTSQLY